VIVHWFSTIIVAEQLKMVGRLHVVLWSIVPTGAALVYLLWMYGWKKPKAARGRQKSQAVEVLLSHVDCERSQNTADTTVVSCDEQLLAFVNNEQDSSGNNDVSVSDYVSVSLRSSCTDLKSQCGDKSISATAVTCEQSNELAVDVGNSSSDHDIAAKANKCYSENVCVSKKLDEIASEDEVLKCPSVDCQDHSTVTLLKDENYCDISVANGNVDVDKVNSDGGCVRNNVPNEGCENGRRDSTESVRSLLSLIVSIIGSG